MQTDPKYFIFAGIGVLILQTILIVIPITAMKRAKKLKIDDDNAVLRMFVLMYCLIYTTLLLKGMWYMNRNGGMFVTERKRKFERPLFGLFGVLIVVNMLFFFASPFVMSIVKGFYPEIPGAFLLNTTITLLATFELLTQRTEYNSSIVKLQNTNAEISSTPLTDENAKTVYELTNYYKRIKRTCSLLSRSETR
ncbi:hypothetical protein M3Y94_01048200 [Aphelenchoides besseyi]|nr:hypothetical protein M3Y94_01048200 [Aphelenchoides besseyi]